MTDHGHSHTHDLDVQTSSTTARLLRWITVGCGLLVIVGAVLLWPDRGSDGADPLALQADPVDAKVTAVVEQPCLGDPESICVTVEFELTSGDQAGTAGSFALFGSGQFSSGDSIRVIPSATASGQPMYSFYDFERRTPMLLLAGLLVVAVIALGRWRGVGALAGLALSLLIIIWFALPAIVDGHNPIAVAMVTSGAVAIVALYLAHGVGPSTDVALLSTLASLAVTGLLGWTFVELAKLTGFTDDAAFTLDALGSGIDARGILLAGIVIGALGVLDDVTVTQVSAVGELARSNPGATRRELFTSALRIGRDHISSTVNTLFLAYAGATLPLLLLFSEIDVAVAEVATREVIATEIVRAMVGSVGLVASVPISTWLATQVIAPQPASDWRQVETLAWRDGGR